MNLLRASAAPFAMTQIQRLFFAVRPEANARDEMSSLGEQLRREHRLGGDQVAGERLHVTLHWLQDHAELPAELIERALVAGAGVDAAPFDVVFDRAGSVDSRSDLIVLTASRGTGSFKRFQRALAGSMTDAGIGRYVRSNFKPHVSLIYGGRPIESQAIVPIRSTVSELVLIHSVVGETKHIELGRWPLQTRQLDLGW